MLHLSKDDARRFLARYHLTPTDVKGVFDRLGSVQYDPLKPVGRNHDLVFQARVPGYRVDDWERIAYEERLVYDAWDKQACLVPISDWPYRRICHRWHRPRWEERILNPHADAVEATLAELCERGPLSSLEFDDQQRVEAWAGSWYGPKLVKQILRALWDTGQVVTHHRDKGRHVYHVAEQVIPAEHFCAPGPADDVENIRWILRRRHQTVGLLRPGAEWAVWAWSMPSAERKQLIGELADDGELVPAEVEGELYHMPAAALGLLEDGPLPDRMVFLAPLDSLMWDRRAVQHLFDFEYIWEVYKPQKQRRWGYYVLPVFYKDRFVARVDSRLDGATWHVHNWLWEEGVTPDAEMLEALEAATRNFMHYLGAEKIRLPRRLDKTTKDVMRSGAKS